jgi:hypothetical protein
MNSRNQSQYSNMSQTTTEQSAIKTLEKLGYTWQGGELWKPPLGANPSPLLTKIDQLQAEVEALRKDAAWQPIETAPKDETPVLIFGGIQHPEVGSSRTITRATLANWSTSSECWDVLDCDYYSVSIENPTHWMPLPKPPTVIVKDTQEQS